MAFSFLCNFCPLRAGAGLAEEREPEEVKAVRHRASVASSKRVFLMFPPKVCRMSEPDGGRAARREVSGEMGEGQTYVASEARGKTVCVRARVGEVETSAPAAAEVDS